MKKRMDVVTIELDEYEELLNDRKLLECLYEAGVDKWEGYGEAMKAYCGEEPEEGDDVE